MRVAALNFFSLVFALSCSSVTDKNELLEGEWRNVSMSLKQQSINNSEQDSLLIVAEGQWDSLLQIKPVRTTYYRNGSFISRYYNLNDSLLFESEGKWHFVGDSLYLSTDEGVTVYLFKMLSGKRANFVATLDWDSDGKSDDLYDGIQQKE